MIVHVRDANLHVLWDFVPLFYLTITFQNDKAWLNSIKTQRSLSKSITVTMTSIKFVSILLFVVLAGVHCRNPEQGKNDFFSKYAQLITKTLQVL